MQIAIILLIFFHASIASSLPPQIEESHIEESQIDEEAKMQTELEFLLPHEVRTQALQENMPAVRRGEFRRDKMSIFSLPEILELELRNLEEQAKELPEIYYPVKE
jgi:hypothetical protein